MKAIPLIRLTNMMILCLSISAPVQSAESPRYVLDKIVMLTRHGVRSPTDSSHYLLETGKQWPQWPVPAGYLTPHGYKGMVQQGAYQFALWKQAGLNLMRVNGCPAKSALWLWTAPDQRTQATGKALLEGMFPGCDLTPHHSRYRQDPLFDTLSMGIAKPNQQRVWQQVAERMGDRKQLNNHYQPAINLFRQAVCAPRQDSCNFLAAGWGLAITKAGKFTLTGPVSKAASMAESIRLAYSENLPLAEVAFGHAKNAHQVMQLMALHAAKYDLLSDTAEYAQHGGSLLLRQLLVALTDQPRTASSAESPLTRPMVIFVGHDTNIAQIQTMLGFNWQLPLYPRNDIPPGGSLIFERYWDRQSKQYFLHLSFTARTLDQWRSLAPLSIQHPLPTAEYTAQGCTTHSLGVLCPLNAFITQAKATLVSDGQGVALYQE